MPAGARSPRRALALTHRASTELLPLPDPPRCSPPLPLLPHVRGYGRAATMSAGACLATPQQLRDHERMMPGAELHITCGYVSVGRGF